MVSYPNLSDVFSSISDRLSLDIDDELLRGGGSKRRGVSGSNSSLFDDDKLSSNRGRSGSGSGARIRPSFANFGAEIKGQIGANISSLSAQGSQAVVVKIASFAGGRARASSLVEYISREGEEEELKLENELGCSVLGGAEIDELMDDWSSEFKSSTPSKDVIGFEVLFPEDVELSSTDAIQILNEALDGHQHVIAISSNSAGQKKASVVALLAGDKKSRLYVEGKRGVDFQAGINETLSGNNKIRVSVLSIGHGEEAVIKYVGASLKQHGSLVDNADKIIRNSEQVEMLSAKWKYKMESRNSRDVMHLILSSKPGTDREKFTAASRDFLKMTFPNHRYVFACHEDRGHFHIHAAVKTRGVANEIINPKKADLSQWRDNMAMSAQAHGINMYNRNLVKSNYPSYKLNDKYMAKVDVSSDIVTDMPEPKPSFMSKMFGKKLRPEADKSSNVVMFSKQFSRAKERIDAHKNSVAIPQIHSDSSYIELSYNASIHKALSEQNNDPNSAQIAIGIEQQQSSFSQYNLSPEEEKLIGEISQSLVELSQAGDKISGFDDNSFDDNSFDALADSVIQYQTELLALADEAKEPGENADQQIQIIISKGVAKLKKQISLIARNREFQKNNKEWAGLFKAAEIQLKVTREHEQQEMDMPEYNVDGSTSADDLDDKAWDAERVNAQSEAEYIAQTDQYALESRILMAEEQGIVDTDRQIESEKEVRDQQMIEFRAEMAEEAAEKIKNQNLSVKDSSEFVSSLSENATREEQMEEFRREITHEKEQSDLDKDQGPER